MRSHKRRTLGSVPQYTTTPTPLAQDALTITEPSDATVDPPTIVLANCVSGTPLSYHVSVRAGTTGLATCTSEHFASDCPRQGQSRRQRQCDPVVFEGAFGVVRRCAVLVEGFSSFFISHPPAMIRPIPIARPTLTKTRTARVFGPLFLVSFSPSCIAKPLLQRKTLSAM